MSGPTLTMAPAVALETSRPFGRSHSSPDLLSHATSDSRRQASLPRNSGVLGSKSLSSGCGFDIPSFEASPEFDTRFFLDGKDFALGQEDKGETVVRTEEVSPLANLETGGPSREKPGNVFRRFSTVERSKGKLSEPRTAFNVGDSLAERPRTHAGVTGEPAASAQLRSASPEPKVEGTKRKKPADSFASFARRTWITSSRSPSPSQSHSQSRNCEEGAPPAAVSARNQPRRDRAKRAGSVSRSPASSPSRKAPVPVPVPGSGSVPDADAELPRREGSPKSTGALHRASSYFTKFRPRPQSMLVKFGNNNRGSESDSNSSRTSSATSLHNPGLTTISIEHEHPKSASFVDTSATSEDECSSGDMPSQRDPLWKGFKELEVEFDKFDGRTTAQRMQLVRATLLVFLRGTSNHYSNKCLHPEDLDRRASILDKWWKGLLDLLDGKGLQPLPGVDRPVLLDAVLLIMTRPEWRQATTYLMPLSDRSPAERVRARSWTNSTRSSLSDSQAEFIAESAEHNVRTTFVANLLTQMAIVVEKMSLRHAPISLVNFCGRACAYAFFFAPGAADILVRLWNLSPEAIRRAADELKLPRTDAGESEDIVALFPPCLAPLGWKDARKASSRLKTSPKVSLALARVPWNSPWVSRWRGGDTDLFFIFCKYFHVLSEEFMPPGLPLVEKARSPGFVLVQAQLLTVLDSTIHRQAAADAMFGLPLHDPAQGADASAMALSALPNGNLMKNMSENRLVVLLKNFLSEDSFRFTAARHTFAEAFVALLRATTTKTSLFNHNACFTLCDFLEEALIAYDEFESADRPSLSPSSSPTLDYVDWSFWFDVLKKMMASRNAMTEVRALSFVFSTWDAVTSDPRRKEALCLDWLLTEETFNEYFNHWCPMVRAYFMRLLCWRICRDAGSASEVDTKIFQAVSSRLKTTWSHYLYLKHTAEQGGKFPPSTAPCLPTPGKKFMIIRTEVNTPQPGLFLDFDTSFSKSLNGTDPDASSLVDTCASSGAMSSKSDSKKRWSLLGKVLSFTAGSAGVPAASSESRPSWEDDSDSEQARKDTTAARSSTPASPPKTAVSAAAASASASSAVSSDGSSTGSSPVYHEQQYVFKFILGAHMYQPNQPRERILTPPRLPAPAQSRMTARFFNGLDDHAATATASNTSAASAGSPSIGAPTPPRRFSGFKQGGLVGDARNPSPRGSPSLAQGPHFSPLGTNDDAGGRQSFSSSASKSPSPRAVSGPFPGAGARQPSPAAASERAVRPTGMYAANAIYAGRALAEWGVIVAECNGFVDRRRHEGVAGLCDVEVPVLGVEGFRRIG